MQSIRFPHTTARFESESTGYSSNCCASDAMHDVSHRKTVSSPDAATAQTELAPTALAKLDVAALRMRGLAAPAEEKEA